MSTEQQKPFREPGLSNKKEVAQSNRNWSKRGIAASLAVGAALGGGILAGAEAMKPNQPEHKIQRELDPNERKVIEAYRTIEGVPDLFDTQITDIDVMKPRVDHPGYEGQDVPALQLTVESHPTGLAKEHPPLLTKDGREVELVWQQTLRADNTFADKSTQASWPYIEGASKVPPVPRSGVEWPEDIVMYRANTEDKGVYKLTIPLGRIDERKMVISEGIHIWTDGISDNEEEYPTKSFGRPLGTITLERGRDGSVRITDKELNEGE